MVGAHGLWIRWAAGDGAMDDGAGAAIVIEAARILATANVKPKGARHPLRALERGGRSVRSVQSPTSISTSQAGQALHLQNDRSGIAQMMMTAHTWPGEVKHPGYSDIKAYFNLDSGGGRIRGVSLQGDLEATPIVKEWLALLSGPRRHRGFSPG